MSNQKVFDVFPYIDLGSIEMRQISSEDIKPFYQYITHENITRFLASADIPDSFESAGRELMYWGRLHSLRSSVYWAISLKSGQIIGTCGFNYWNQGQKRTEISYDIDHNYWGKGFATAAVRAMTDFAFLKMQVKRIQATVAVHNLASIKVLEKVGYQREGMMSNYGILEGKSKDFYMYAKIPE
jgi:[ribosomal protein S5]-alanine N-acetyltransferase